MNFSGLLPRLLVIDDVLGRTIPDRRNEDRERFCGQFLIEDVCTDEIGRGSTQRIRSPIAQAVFHRGQTPVSARLGDVVENNLDDVARIVREGWDKSPCWSLVLLDLCFYTGSVTERSVASKGPGLPAGKDDDESPSSYFGLKILEKLRSLFPELPIIILSGQPRDDVSRRYSVLGALGFLERDAPRGSELLRGYIHRHGLIPDEAADSIGQSRDLLLALRAARRFARSAGNLLFRGERGTGKELLSRYVHRQRPDAGAAPFIVVNSPILSNELFASELFGIEKRVATQVDQRDGLIRAADGGDLFFDEIRDMIPQAQAAIRRALEERAITPVGAKGPLPVNVRFLSATNADIEAFADAGTFLPDLLDRLRDGGTISLPPLRHRKEDIPLLVNKFLRDAEAKISGALRREIEPETLEKLKDYDWPGNIRELRDCIRQAVTNNPDVEHLAPVHIQFQPGRSGASHRSKPPESSANSAPPVSIDSIAEVIKEFSFDHLRVTDLKGKLGDLEEAVALLLARYVRAALKEHPKDDPQAPYFIERAFKCIGGKAYDATKAYDYVKWLFDISQKASEALREDPVLGWAQRTSAAKRASKSRKKAETRMPGSS